jgi:small multidrug resistance pump
MPILASHPALLVALSTLTALGYAGATVGMKLAATGAPGRGLVFMGLGFAAAALAEIVLMRRFDVSMIYVVIIALETLLILCFAYSIGERLSSSQIAGALLVVMGLGLTLR